MYRVRPSRQRPNGGETNPQPTQFGIIVTIYTLGGLVGSLGSDAVTQRYGRVGTFRIAETLFVLGTAAVGLSNVMWLMALGRVAVGIGAGLSLVSVPLFLAEVFTSKSAKTYFGTMHQMSIGTGMIVAQSLSIPFAHPWQWRWVLVIGLAIAAGLLLLSGGVSNPSLDMTPGADEETSLLRQEAEGDEGAKDEVSVRGLVHAGSLVQRGLLVVVAAQFAQQICGISPVMYFSTQILAPVFQGSSKLVALAVMAIGIPFNFVPGLLPQSVGSKRLLLLSATGTAVSSLTLGIGLNGHNRAVSGISVIAFVLAFSSGLAPVPWVVLAEVVPMEARTASGAVAVSINWLTNFAAGAAFLPIQQALKRGDRGEGNVFFVFAGASALAFALIWAAYKLYDRAARSTAE
ncbi:putative vacuolar membrane protein [Papiliotrema laurentii]|uniref:Vacuolar membrane protein n=1 Tax=Papiliotrema laurentii TaxID=5418 RepID=A0AAD9CZP3_PAPLA|nr:putative vacuolar membrane protein [Papiliotrema laurentii]